jgi:peptidoglycan/LPS O-acetylase OafA/YrhL
MASSRIPNLDLIRGTAIAMVLVFHSVQFLPSKPGLIWALSKPGHYGVELFFVLSGYLIGILYFRELASTGSVDTERFILRRITRTIPPYLLALAPAFLGSYIFEKEHFRWEYLLFLQNYLPEIPYFMPSWSLCVEEHFYLLLPFILSLLVMVGRRLRIASMAIAIILLASPSILRVVEYKDLPLFGYFRTASHFHFDALFLGVFAAWASLRHPHLAPKLEKHRPLILATSLAALLMSSLLSEKLTFLLATPIISFLFMLVVLCLAHGRQYGFSRSKTVALLAGSSYAIYLTHTMVLQAVMKAYSRQQVPMPVLWAIMITLCLAIGYLFYTLFETRLMDLRDRIIPSTNRANPQPSAPSSR